jgi:hypothetical protein
MSITNHAFVKYNLLDVMGILVWCFSNILPDCHSLSQHQCTLHVGNSTAADEYPVSFIFALQMPRSTG